MSKLRTTKDGKSVQTTIGRKAFAAISAVEGIKPPPTTVADLTLIPGDTPPAPEVLEQAIVDLSAAWKQFTGTRVRRSILVMLLHHTSGVGKRDITEVLSALDRLEGNVLMPQRPVS